MKRLRRFSIVLCIILAFTFVVPSTAVLQLPTVTNVEAATKVKLSKTSIKIAKGESYQLKVTGTKAKVKWSSTKKSVATVSSKGKVKGKAKGTAYIKAKVGKKTLKCKVSVLATTKKTYNETLLFDVSQNAWHYDMSIKNSLSKKVTIKSLIIRDLLDGKEVGRHDMDLNRIKLADVTIGAKSTFKWNDNHPYTTEFNSREYRFTVKADDGTEVVYSFNFKMIKIGSATYDPDKDDTSVYTHRETVDLDTSMNWWHYVINIENPLLQKITIIGLSVRDLMGNRMLREHEIDLAAVGLASVTLNPQESIVWKDNHPYTMEFDTRDFRIKCRAADGSIITLSYICAHVGTPSQQEDVPPVDYSNDPGRDLKTLRHNAKYKVSIGDGLYWVPASTLGSSSYTNAEIQAMVNCTPEEKRNKIDTLYEAIQLYEIGNFKEAQDNVRIYENGVDWEHHKPGYYSVISNCGCCASDSSWLSYILAGDYEEIGYIQISQPDGGGHVINYIKSDGWYYTIDMTHYRNDFLHTAVESGRMEDFNRSDIILGNILAVKDLKTFANFFVSAANDPPGLIIQERMQDVPAIDGVHSGSKVTITYGSDQEDKLTVLYDNPNDQLFLGFATPPTKFPNWAAICS